MSRMNWMTLVLIAVLFGAAAWYYPSLPDPVPSQWNLAGQVDTWTAKPMGVWLIPLIAAGMTAVLLVLPLIAPRGFRLDNARRAYDTVVFLLAAAQIIFFVNMFWSLFMGPRTVKNPWQANTLEWSAPSPPPHGNFEAIPVVYRGPYEYSPPHVKEDYLPQHERLEGEGAVSRGR